MTTELNQQQAARLARLNKRNPTPASASPSAPLAAPMTSAAAIPPPPPGSEPQPVGPHAAATASAAGSALNEQQLARLARLGKRGSTAAASSGAVLPTAAAAVATPPPASMRWNPPVGPPAADTHIVIEPAATATVPVVDRHTSVRLFGSRRRHVAAAGRILATGLATSGFLATIASLATADARALEAEQADAAPPTTLLETIHRVVYVDEFGNPIAPPTTLSPLETHNDNHDARCRRRPARYNHHDCSRRPR